jgi:hypothetical protein
LSPLGAKHEPEDLKLVETWIKERMGTLISSTLSLIRSIGCIGLATLDHSLVMMPKSIARGNDTC